MVQRLDPSGSNLGGTQTGGQSIKVYKMNAEQIIKNMQRRYKKKQSALAKATGRAQSRAARNVKVFIRKEIQRSTGYKTGVLNKRITFANMRKRTASSTARVSPAGAGFTASNGVHVPGQPLNVANITGSRMNAQRRTEGSRGDRRRSSGVVTGRGGSTVKEGFIAHRGPGKSIGTDSRGRRGYFAVRKGADRHQLEGIKGKSPGKAAAAASTRVQAAYRNFFIKEMRIQTRKLL